MKKRLILLSSLLFSVAILFSSCLPALLLMGNSSSKAVSETARVIESSSMVLSSSEESSSDSEALSSSEVISSSEAPSSSEAVSSKEQSSSAPVSSKAASSSAAKAVTSSANASSKVATSSAATSSKKAVTVVGNNNDYGTETKNDSQVQASDNQSTTVYITNTGEKYHTGDCQYLRKSKKAISLADAKTQGYSACSKCNPPR